MRLLIIVMLLVVAYAFAFGAFGMISSIPLGIVYFVGLYQGLYINLSGGSPWRNYNS